MRLLYFLLLSSVAFSVQAQKADTYFREAQAAYDRQQFETAFESTQKAIRKDATQAPYHYLQALCLLELDKPAEAMDAISKAIELDPKKLVYWADRATLFNQFKQYELADADYTSCIELAETDTQRLEYILYRSSARMGYQNYDGAYFDLTNAYAQDSTHKGVLLNLGQICDYLGKDEEVFKYFFRSIELYPDYYPAYQNVGFKYVLMGEF